MGNDILKAIMLSTETFRSCAIGCHVQGIELQVVLSGIEIVSIAAFSSVIRFRPLQVLNSKTLLQTRMLCHFYVGSTAHARQAFQGDLSTFAAETPTAAHRSKTNRGERLQTEVPHSTIAIGRLVTTDVLFRAHKTINRQCTFKPFL